LLWRDDYVRLSNFLETGLVVCLSGSFRQRFATSPFEFQVNGVTMLETMLRNNTKKVHIDINAEDITEDLVDFMATNVEMNPGPATLKMNVYDIHSNHKCGMYTSEKGFEMNDEMAHFLQSRTEVEVKVELT
jgi:DNA polymerase-3 subunit alpha